MRDFAAAGVSLPAASCLKTSPGSFASERKRGFFCSHSAIRFSSRRRFFSRLVQVHDQPVKIVFRDRRLFVEQRRIFFLSLLRRGLRPAQRRFRLFDGLDVRVRPVGQCLFQQAERTFGARAFVGGKQDRLARDMLFVAEHAELRDRRLVRRADLSEPRKHLPRELAVRGGGFLRAFKPRDVRDLFILPFGEAVVQDRERR